MTVTTTLPPIPEKLTDLIELALADAKTLDRDKYIPDAGNWHNPKPSRNTCLVCLAGMIMVGTLGLRPTDVGIPRRWYDEDPKWTDAIMALDDVRDGDYVSAVDKVMSYFEVTVEVKEKLTVIPTARPELFSGWEQWDQFARQLETEVLPALRELGV